MANPISIQLKEFWQMYTSRNSSKNFDKCIHPVTTSHSRNIKQKIPVSFVVIPSPWPQAAPDQLAAMID